MNRSPEWIYFSPHLRGHPRTRESHPRNNSENHLFPYSPHHIGSFFIRDQSHRREGRR